MLSELKSMEKIAQILLDLDDNEAQKRVLLWACSKFSISNTNVGEFKNETTNKRITTSNNEIKGIAHLTEKGDLKLIARDFKGSSKLNTALRIALVSIYTYELLTSKRISSRKILTPILKDLRVYDGNSRYAIKSHKGILRNGDELYLDTIAKEEAEKITKEILDDSISGTWSYKSSKTKTGGK